MLSQDEAFRQGPQRLHASAYSHPTKRSCPESVSRVGTLVYIMLEIEKGQANLLLKHHFPCYLAYANVFLGAAFGIYPHQLRKHHGRRNSFCPRIYLGRATR